MSKFVSFINEVSRATSKPAVEGKFAVELNAKYPNFIAQTGAGPMRINNKTDKTTPEEFSKILGKMGATDIEMLNPKEGAFRLS